MFSLKSITILLVLCVYCNCILKSKTRVPIIALITMTATAFDKELEGADKIMSSIPASYVQWVEQTGALVVIQPYDQPFDDLVKKLELTQGLVLPGGGSNLLNPRTEIPTFYQNRISKIVEWAIDRNNQGIYYPVWGTCLGMQEVYQALFDDKNDFLSTGLDDNKKLHNVLLHSDYWESELFGNLNIDRQQQKEQYNNPIFYYYHNDGVDQDTFFLKKVYEKFNLLGTSKTDKGVHFVAMMQAREYPFFLTQFHPEKYQFELTDYYSLLDRKLSTINLMSAYIFRFVEIIRKKSVKEMPKSQLHVSNELKPYLSYNNIAYKSPVRSFESLYVFQDHKSKGENIRNYSKNQVKIKKILSN